MVVYASTYLRVRKVFRCLVGLTQSLSSATQEAEEIAAQIIRRGGRLSQTLESSLRRARATAGMPLIQNAVKISPEGCRFSAGLRVDPRSFC